MSEDKRKLDCKGIMCNVSEQVPEPLLSCPIPKISIVTTNIQNWGLDLLPII